MHEGRCFTRLASTELLPDAIKIVSRNAKISLPGFAALTAVSIILGLCAGLTGYIVYMPSVMSLPENLVALAHECAAPGSVAYFRTEEVNARSSICLGVC